MKLNLVLTIIGHLVVKSLILSGQEPRKIGEKCPTFENSEKSKQEVNSMETGLTKTQKTTEIWFNEKEPTIHVRTHNTDLKSGLPFMPRNSRTHASCLTTIPSLAAWSLR